MKIKDTEIKDAPNYVNKLQYEESLSEARSRCSELDAHDQEEAARDRELRQNKANEVQALEDEVAKGWRMVERLPDGPAKIAYARTMANKDRELLEAVNEQQDLNAKLAQREQARHDEALHRHQDLNASISAEEDQVKAKVLQEDVLQKQAQAIRELITQVWYNDRWGYCWLSCRCECTG